jgi:hypothetical protein
MGRSVNSLRKPQFEKATIERVAKKELSRVDSPLLRIKPLHIIKENLSPDLSQLRILKPWRRRLAAQVISEHVDFEMRQFLIELLLSFVGAVLVISHDPDFR